MSTSSPRIPTSHRRGGIDHLRTLVLNSDGCPLAVISWKRAICLVFEGRVVQVEFHAGEAARDGRGRAHAVPAVVMLRRYIRRRHRRAPFSRRNVMIRDRYRCAYCGRGAEGDRLTMDHVIPRSRWTGSGPATCWENVVACCRGCNKRKGDRMCGEVSMSPRIVPAAPSYAEMLVGLDPFRDSIPPEWAAYLSDFPILQGISHDPQSESLEARLVQRQV